MLDQFIADNREEIIRRCRVKVASRSSPEPTSAELQDGVPRFLDQLVVVLRDHLSSNTEIDQAAARHGRHLHTQGFTVGQVVRAYGDVCQAVTELALLQHAPISVDEFHTLNRCLDDAVASAVTEHGRGNQLFADAESARDDERLVFLAHEIRNLVSTAMLALQVLRTGNVGVSGSTGGVLLRSLEGLTALINRSLAEVRLRRQIQTRTHFAAAEFIAEAAASSVLDANARGIVFVVDGGHADVHLDADRATLAASVANLVQNAFKFTKPATSVTLRCTATASRVLIEVEDHCGGLPDGDVQSLFLPFEQRSPDRSGLGLGLTISRWGAEANDGHISAPNVAGHGCVFTIDLPRSNSGETS